MELWPEYEWEGDERELTESTLGKSQVTRYQRQLIGRGRFNPCLGHRLPPSRFLSSLRHEAENQPTATMIEARHFSSCKRSGARFARQVWMSSQGPFNAPPVP